MPVSPYPSLRDPTRYVMLTVMVGFDGSGNSRNRRPLGRLYSVMPSTVGPLVARGGAAGALGAGFAAGGACWGWTRVGAVVRTARARLSTRRSARTADMALLRRVKVEGSRFRECCLAQT